MNHHQLTLLSIISGCYFAVMPSIAQAADYTWDLAVLDDLASKTAPDEVAVSKGCMQLRGWQVRGFRDKLRMIAGGNRVTPQFAVQSPVTLWPGGVVPYVFDASVTASQQRIFLDAAGDISTFANVSFVTRTSQANYVLVKYIPTLGGGQSAVGMVGGAQNFDIGFESWNRWTLLHEMGHTLGLVHEHQRPDRDAYVTIQTANIKPGFEPFFTVLAATTTGAYDFLSVMHYRRDAAASAAGLNTIVPKPAYAAFLDEIGDPYDRALSALDRAGLAATYGAKPAPPAVVTNTKDSGPGSLNAAIYRAIDVPGTTITFNIPTSDPGYNVANGTWTIRPTDQLPTLGKQTTIDATTQPGGAASGPKIVLEGAYVQVVDVFAYGLKITEDQCVVRGLAVRDFDGDAITMIGAGATDNVITGCHLGCDSTGTIPASSGWSGVTMYGGAKRNRVGGPLASDRNIISGNKNPGVAMGESGTSDNIVQGNYIGARPNGTQALPNAGGVQLDTQASNNIFQNNVISGNHNYGIILLHPGTTGNRIEGNIIGASAGGNAALANEWTGVAMIEGASRNRVGGTLPGERNIISGNAHAGVYIHNVGTQNNIVAGNYIGTNATGTAALANAWSGLQISGGASNNLVGGNSPGAGNLISGNGQSGMFVSDNGTTANRIEGNIIGLNAAGNAKLSNVWSGVVFYGGTKNNTLGGSAGARNYISGNSNYGVELRAAGTSNNVIAGNTIGLDITGSVSLGNTWDGLAIYEGATDNTVGGAISGSANRIAANGYRGVVVLGSTTNGNAILGNSIDKNGDAPIMFFDGGNGNQSAPILNSATMTTNLTVNFSYNAVASTIYRIEFYAFLFYGVTGQPEASTYLGAADVTTNASGQFNGNIVLPTVVPGGARICATATSPGNNTSILSNAVSLTYTDTDGDGLPNAWETANGLNPNNNADGAIDSDGDGFTAYQEFIAGTDPRSGNSRPTMQSPTSSSGNVQVGFPSVSGRTYRILKSPDLITWNLWLDHIIGTGAVMNFTDTGAAGLSRQFYRTQAGGL
jgi:hypothetical protein